MAQYLSKRTNLQENTEKVVGILNSSETKTIGVVADSLDTLLEKGKTKVLVNRPNNVILMNIKTMEIIDSDQSFKNLDEDSVLKFVPQAEVEVQANRKEKDSTRTYYVRSAKQKGNLKKLLDKLKNDMALLVRLEGEDLTMLADLDDPNIFEDYGQDFIEEVTLTANERLLEMQNREDAKGLLMVLNHAENKKEDIGNSGISHSETKVKQGLRQSSPKVPKKITKETQKTQMPHAHVELSMIYRAPTNLPKSSRDSDELPRAPFELAASSLPATHELR